MINPQLALAIKAAVDGQQVPLAPSALPPGVLPMMVQSARAVTDPGNYMKMAGNQSDQAYGQFAKSIQAPQPKPAKRVGWGDAIGLGLGALIGKLLFHSTDNDLAQFGQGFMGAREQSAQRQDEQNMRTYQQTQDQAKLKYQHEMGKANDTQEFAKSLMGIKAAQYKDQNDFKQAKELEELKQKGLNYRADLKDPAKVAAFKALSGTGDGRAIVLQRAGMGDPDAIEAVRQLTEAERKTAAETNKINTLLPGQVDQQAANLAKTTAQTEGIKVTNQNLQRKFDTDNAYREAATKFLGTRDRLYPDMIAAIGADRARRLDIQEFAARNSVGNAQFDNEVKDYENKTKDERDTLKAELGAINTQRTKLTADIAKATDEEERAALSQQLATLNNQHAKKAARLKTIADNSPVFKAGDGVGIITPKGSKGGFAPMGVSMPNGVPNPALTPAQRAQGDAAAKKMQPVQNKPKKAGDKLKSSGFKFGGK